ncbi:MAG: type II/IV secretion system protein [Candidatus Kerfeldbacteria bacterium]|nr:type II/IV secretion system protein [Candidatus Kerfeldbacteria bacterium]
MDDAGPTQKPYQVAPEATQERFKQKMEEIELREKERLTREEAAAAGLGYIDLTGFPIGAETLTLLTEAQAREYTAIVFLRTGKELRIGVVDPNTPGLDALVEELGHRERAHVVVYLISRHSFEQAVKLYAHIPKIKKPVSGVEVTEEDIERYRQELGNLWDLEVKLKQASLTEVFSMILAGAIQGSASDIHIEAEEQDVKIRYRIDGVLQTVASLRKEAWPRIINRIKLLAGLKININTVPQDGRITLLLPNDKIDVRVSSLPTSYGESVVMRLLMASSQGLKYADLGLRGNAFEQLEKEIHRPNGMVVTTGPTGSGKTTTLYAFLNELNQPDTKIITLEDPIEYKLQGINQSQVDASKDYTFAKGLRAVLRQDPDIIMVGEIRDTEAGDIAIQAALTGHLVLSTLHTNNAAGAIPRFLALGMKTFLLAPALNAVIGQRLVRKLCEHCKQGEQLSPDLFGRVQSVLASVPAASGAAPGSDRKLTFWKAVGCRQCNRIGYKGRIGIFEVFTITPEIEKLILGGQATEHEIQETAVKAGMITMVQDGILKALDGITSVEEVFKVAE